MLLLGLLALVQIGILPGFIAIHILRIGGGIFLKGTAVFLLSLLINHLTIFLLVVFGFYTRSVVLSLFGFEILIAIWMAHNAKGTRLLNVFDHDKQSILAFTAKFFPEVGGGAYIASYIAALAAVTLLYYLAVFVGNIGGIFDMVDAVHSWNRWAVDWAHNSLPKEHWLYPQLLPSVWSLTYLFIGTTDIQFFAKAIAPFFPLFTLSILLQMAIERRDFAFVIAVPIAGLLMGTVEGPFLNKGYADIPVGLFTLAAVYFLFCARNAADGVNARAYLFLGAAASAGAALVKQPGLLTAFTYPLLAWALLIRGMYSDTGAELKLTSLLAATIIIIISPWYIYNLYEIYSESQISNLGYLTTEMHAGRNLVQRTLHGISILRYWIPGSAVLMPAIMLFCLLGIGKRDL